MKQKAIIISRSNVPVVRAGLSNIIFFLLFIALILINQLLNDFDIGLVLKAVIIVTICILTWKIYNRSVSKICIKGGDSLILVGPVSESVINTSEVELIKIYGIPSSMTIFIMIKMKNAALPKFYFFVSISTNYGSYEDTKSKLNSLLSEVKAL